MAGSMKKLGIIIFLLILLPVLSSCEGLENSADLEYNYLNISADSQYGFETIEPDLGRYRYENGSIVEIDFQVAEGYSFLGWQGNDGDKVVESNSGQYRIKLDGDKSIEAALELNEYMFLNVRFGNEDPINKDELGNETHRISSDTNQIRFKFNNDIGTSEEAINIYFDNLSEDNQENGDDGLIASDNISIEDNLITVEISNSFFEENLGFGERYLVKGDRSDDSIRVSDIEGNSTRIEAFEVATETVQPESPFLSREKVSESEVELFWAPSLDNSVGYGDTYVSKYNIYRSNDKENFSNEVYDVKEVSNPEEVSEIVYNDDNLNNDEIYYYRVTAELDKEEYDVHWEDGNQESEFSNIVDTDF